nr:MAG TPA: hypothetical protein [Caudoviricetes sp.]
MRRYGSRTRRRKRTSAWAWTFSKTFVQADVSRSSRSAQRCSTANATSISSSRKIEYVRVNSTFIMFLKTFVSAIF